MAAVTEIFQPVTTPAPDWSAATNWSGGAVPGADVAAAIDGTVAVIDPGVTLEADLTLGSANGHDAALSGNFGAVVLGGSSDLSVSGTAALYADDSVVNQGFIAVGAASDLAVVVDLGAISGLTGAPAPSFANAGMIALSSGAALDIGGTEFENSGLVTLAGGSLDVTGGAIGGGGTIALDYGAVASFRDGVADQHFSFGSGGGTLELADPLLGAGVTVSGFTIGDAIMLNGLADAGIVQTGDEVTIMNRTGGIDASFDLAAPVDLLVTAASGGSVILAATTAPSDPPCFARGTALLTPSGYRPVEQLVAGDAVVTADGAVQIVIWVGSHTLDLALHRDPPKVQPIRIAASALAPGVPRRVLRVSPDHALWFDGVLIPAKLLVNGATIVQEADTLAVTYHHVELARHDVVLAEAATCETYLDTGNRHGFSVADSWPVRAKRWDRDACAPLVTSGARLRTVRRRLHARALACGFTMRQESTIDLLIDGCRIGPAGSGRYVLPRGHGGSAVLRSRRFVPAEFDPDSEDRRQLGIALAGVRIGKVRVKIDEVALAGFHPRATDDLSRWTDGTGSIRLPQACRTIAFEIAALPLIWDNVGFRA